MSKPKVSIIVPIYNVEKYLDRCMQSVLNQTLKDIEIIMVDDGSPDNCPSMCDEYARKDNRIKVIHKKNGGLGFARNSGLEIATGEYVAFIDSDDFIDTSMYETLYNTAKSHGLDTCFCGFNYYKNGKATPRREVTELKLFRGECEVKKFLLDMIGPAPSYPHEVKYLMCVWKAIYSMPVINKNHLRFDSEKELASEDILFHSIYLPKCQNIGFIPECFYYYCENATSISRTYSDAKFLRIKKNLIEVKHRLDNVCSQNEYIIHYQRYLLLSLRGVLWHEIYSSTKGFKDRMAVVKSRCMDDVYSSLLKDFPYKQLNWQKRLLYLTIKKKNPYFVFLFYQIQKILGR